MTPSELLRRAVAPVAVAGGVAAVVYAAVQPHAPPTPRDPLAPASSAPVSTTSSPYWTLPPTTVGPGNPQVAMDAVQWAQVAYPGACGPQASTTTTTLPFAAPSSTTLVSTGFTVDQVQFAQPDASDSLAIVLVQCGSAQPVALYAYRGALSVTDPTLLQTLIPTAQDVFASAFSAQGSRLSITVTSGVPAQEGACCSGLTYQLHWIWSQGQYRASP